MTDVSQEGWSELMAQGSETDVSRVLERIPYVRTIGMTVEQKGRELTFVLPFRKSNIGNPILPALHGGVLGAFLETASIAELLWDVKLASFPKPVDIGIDYLRSGRPVDTYARAMITKRGRRVANVRAEAWQEERAKPIAALHGHFLIDQVD